MLEKGCVELWQGWGAGGVGGSVRRLEGRPGCRAVTGREAGGYAAFAGLRVHVRLAVGLVCCAEAAFHRAAMMSMEGDGGRAHRVHSG